MMIMMRKCRSCKTQKGLLGGSTWPVFVCADCKKKRKQREEKKSGEEL